MQCTATVGLLALALVACGGGGGRGDSSAPSVLTVSPAEDSSRAVITTDISATFDRAMDPDSIDTTTFTVTGPTGDLAGIVSYDSDNDRAIFTLLTELLLDETYVAALARTIVDTDGRTLGEAFIWSFRTGGRLVRVSVSVDDTEADGCSFDPTLSESGAIIRISIAGDGLTDGDAASLNAAISADGRYVAFESDASNLVLDDFNELRDVFRGFNALF